MGKLSYTTAEIDAILGRAQEGGTIDQNLATNLQKVTQALDGKAPAGYGLGTLGQDISGGDLNDAISCGFYSWGTGVNTLPANAPFAGGIMLSLKRSRNDNVFQFIFRPATGEMVRRVNNNGTWGDPEWINPPLVLGTEYRTTERYLGKPVYAMAVSLGDGPAGGSSKAVTIASLNAATTDALRISAYMVINGRKQTLPYMGYFTGTTQGDIGITFFKNQVQIDSTYSGAGVYPMYATLYYTKTTD